MILVPARITSVGLDKLSSPATELLGTGVYLQNKENKKKTFDYNDATNIKRWIKTKWREEWVEMTEIFHSNIWVNSWHAKSNTL